MNHPSFKLVSIAALILASLTACSTMAPESEGTDRAERAVAVTASNKLLKFNADKALQAKVIDHANLDEAHAILVGDHGQGAFRMMATLLLI